MKIGIVDADLLNKNRNRFPNLACMKISGFYKEHGHEVELLTNYDLVSLYDRVFISKVFIDTVVPAEILELPNVEYGGTGFFYDKAPRLSEEIEHHFPDYDLYSKWIEDQVTDAKNKWIANGEDAEDFNEKGFRKKFSSYTDYSIGFTTRGCIRGCSFCVNQHYRMCSLHSPVSEFVDPNRPYIFLLDDNVLSCPQWKQIFEDLNVTGKRFRFHQGMDERLLTDEKCEVIFNSNWIGDFIFAFDNIKDRRIVIKKLNQIRKHTDRENIKFYCFCAYNHDEPEHYNELFWAKDILDLFERIRILMLFHCLPYVMRYQDYRLSPHKGMYVTIARWCNQPSFFKKMSFREFCHETERHGSSSAVRYMREFEAQFPEIAEEYFDMKWGDPHSFL
jgi:hypothetical protein